MTEHEVCKGCQWNNYPFCTGSIGCDGEFMNIESLESGFGCGQKDSSVAHDLILPKSDVNKKIEDLESRIQTLENK